MKLILPATKWWLEGLDVAPVFCDPPQGVQYERYWRRAVNEAFDQDDVKDQVVLRDTKKWMETPGVESELVVGICASRQYGDLWEHFSRKFFAGRTDRVL